MILPLGDITNMKIYKIEFEMAVADCWIDDGISSETLKRRIKNELPSNLCPYAYGAGDKGGEIFIKNLKIRKQK